MTTTNAPKTSYVRNFQPRTKEDQREIWYTQFPVDAVWGIYARQSSPAQVKNNTQSTEMQTDELNQWLLDRGVSQERIFLFDADLGKSGRKRIDERSALQDLVWEIEADKIKAVLVYLVSRLFRDETGIQYNTFAQVCKEHNCLLVMANGMVFNFRNDMHLRMFRYLADHAAEDNAQRSEMFSQMKLHKARKGLYAGLGTVPSGFIVDYNKHSPTFEKFIPYNAHAQEILVFFKRYFELAGDFQKLCRELEAKSCVFPEFEEDVDERNSSRWKRRHSPGGDTMPSCV